MKRIRKLTFLLVMALMVLAMAIPVYAQENNGAYVVTQSTATGTIHVKVVVETKEMEYESGSAFYNVYDVALNSGYTVQDALFKLARDEGEFELYDEDYNFVWDSLISQNYIYALGSEDYLYEPMLLKLQKYYYEPQDGLSFRVNGKYPLTTWNGQSDVGPIGATMSETPVNDGDVIHFFWDCPRVKNSQTGSLYSVNFVHPTSATYASGTLSVAIMNAHSYHSDPPVECWNISPYGSCGSAYAGTYPYRIFMKGSNNVVASGNITLSNQGAGTITNLSLDSSNTYYIEIGTQTFKTEYAEDNTPCVILANTNAFGIIQ